MKVKTSELTNHALAYAVSTVENKDWDTEGHIANISYPDDGTGWVYRPDIDWSQGGPIIRQNFINLLHCQNGSAKYEVLAQMRECADITSRVIAQAWGRADDGPERDLVAAMRCYVASRLGDEVEIPEELMA